MLKHLRQFLQRTEAATAVEYAVMLALILMVVIGSIYLLGQNTMGSITNSNNQLNEYGFGS
jgi:Flp pilus assembly pilin Flp